MSSPLIAWLRARWLRIFTVLGLSTALAAAGCGSLAEKERELTFRIVPGDASWYTGMPAGIREMSLPVLAKDKTQHIDAWWWPGADPEAPAVLYLHGSRWNLTGQLFRIEQLRDFGFSVLAIDYRGFGKSDGGLPSEDTVYEDARVAWQRLEQLQPDASKRFIYGHSLGGAVAIDLAAKLSTESARTLSAVPARGLIVESSFTTLADIARALTYPWLPVQLLLSQKFDSVDKIGHVKMPVLIVHGVVDRYVPSRFSQALYDSANDPKKLLLVDGATHNNSMREGSAAYRKALNELFGVAPSTANAPELSPSIRQVVHAAN